nr:metallophosphoesterase [Massilia phyllostachyos]
MRWIHLTDLHVGQYSQDWLWPNFKNLFFDDLELLCRQIGGFDLLIFSGDLTQKGSAEEYDALTSVLKDIYDKLQGWGAVPKFFAVPGNHDLVRPNGDLPESLLLKRWWEEPAVRKTFWSNDKSIYRLHLVKAFENYTKWYDGLAAAGIPTLDTHNGLLPGDKSARVEINGLNVGVIGLNSTFLQIDGGDYNNKLELDPRQLLAVTDADPTKWCASNDVNFLVTHHPAAWLAPSSFGSFNTEISPPGRFTAHLFGHMHTAASSTVSLGGGPTRRSIQGCSIFGLEHLRDGTTDRRHGYSAGRILIQSDETEWRLWPRVTHVRPDGARQMIPDYDFALVPGEQYATERTAASRDKSVGLSSPTLSKISPELILTSIGEGSTPSNILDQCQYVIKVLEHHLVIRNTAQQACATAIALDRMVWLCTDWGLGTDGFIYSFIKFTGRASHPIYKISLGNYTNRQEFLIKFSEQYGCSFAEFCRDLLKVGPATLIFDDAPTTSVAQADTIVLDVEALGQMVLDFCPQVVVLAVTRVRPMGGQLSHVELAPLDEPDTRAYIFAHPEAAKDIKNSRGVSEIFRITEGVPNKIDRVLKTLRVVTLPEIALNGIDRTDDQRKSKEEVPRALSSAVSAILESSDPSTQRTALMLKLLCILPHGETLQKIKRFDPQKVFYSQHAEELLDRALIDVKTSFGVMNKGAQTNSEVRLLSVPAHVRDYVRSLLSEREVEALIRKAMGLYFEQHRTTSQWKLRAREGKNLSDDVTTLDNAHELALRTLVRAVDAKHISKAKSALALVQLYCGELMAGRHYRSCAVACESILRAIQEDVATFSKEILSLQYSLARCLRMLGESERAKSLFEDLRFKEWPKEMKVSLLLDYALCLQADGDQNAITVAKELISLSPKSGSAIQAKAIILELENEDDAGTQLLKLENEAKKRGALIVRNNLILSRANDSADDDEILEALEEVLQTSLKSKDAYNAGRASVKIATLMLRRKETLTNEVLNRLMATYQYFYGQRFDKLFVDAHKALWQVFEENGDIPNLLSLFKHSSFIWRLGGNEAREKPYIQKLLTEASHILTTDLRTADQETAYFVARTRSAKDRISQW